MTRHSWGAETIHPVHRPKTLDCNYFCCAAEVLSLGADWRLSCLSLMPLPLRQADRPLIREPVEGDAVNSATDTDWFRYLRERNAEEMNFWRPRATTKFKILEQNERFYSNPSI